MTPAGRCTYCGQEIVPDRDYQKVVGWERRRAQGGTNALRARTPKDEWACQFCVDKLAKGIAPAQGSLI